MDTTTRAGSPLRQRMLDDMRMRKLEPRDAGRLHPRRSQADRLPRPIARHRHRRGPAQLPTAPGRHRHLADHAQRDAHRAEVLLRHHAGPRRADGQDAAGARAAHAARGARVREEVARLIAAARNLKHQAALSVAYGAGPARQRGRRAEGRRRRQPAHDAARGAGQGPQGSLRHAQPGAAAAAARLVARGPCPGQDPARRLAVPGPGSDGPADRTATQPRRPRRRRRPPASTSA